MSIISSISGLATDGAQEAPAGPGVRRGLEATPRRVFGKRGAAVSAAPPDQSNADGEFRRDAALVAAMAFRGNSGSPGSSHPAFANLTGPRPEMTGTEDLADIFARTGFGGHSAGDGDIGTSIAGVFDAISNAL